MALMRYGIPNRKIEKFCRLKVKDDFGWLSRFFTTNCNGIYEKPIRELTFPWIRENCQGYVYYISYEFKDISVIEYFFKTEADTVKFKMAFNLPWIEQ